LTHTRKRQIQRDYDLYKENYKPLKKDSSSEEDYRGGEIFCAHGSVEST
jgi:hypothetical protein